MYDRIGAANEKLGRFGESLLRREEGLKAIKGFVENDESGFDWQYKLVWQKIRIAILKKEHQDISQYASELERKGERGAFYDASCAYSLSVKVLFEKGQDDLATKQRSKAIQCLGAAISAGYSNFEHMKQDSDLDSIRNSEEFRKLIKSVESENQ